jgi:predicted transposase YdaD
MKESVIDQEILAKGITEGEILGFKKGEANLILKQINRRVGNISTDWVNKIQELSLEQLEDLGEALLDFTSQSDLINWFNYLGSSLLFMLNQHTRCQDNILLTQKFRKFLKP